jgi:hypothetical protein
VLAKTGKVFTPKVHMLEDHVMECVIELGGLGGFDEECVERSHQLGKRSDERQKQTTRNAVRKFVYFARWEKASTNPVVDQIPREVDASRKRKRTTGAIEATSNKQKRADNKRLFRESGLIETNAIKKMAICHWQEINVEPEAIQ